MAPQGRPHLPRQAEWSTWSGGEPPNVDALRTVMEYYSWRRRIYNTWIRGWNIVVIKRKPRRAAAGLAGPAVVAHDNFVTVTVAADAGAAAPVRPLNDSELRLPAAAVNRIARLAFADEELEEYLAAFERFRAAARARDRSTSTFFQNRETLESDWECTLSPSRTVIARAVPS